MELNITQYIDIDADIDIVDIYNQMSDSDIEEMIELFTKDGHLKSKNKDEFYQKTHSDLEWEHMLNSLMGRNILLLITDEEYSQIRNIYNRLGQ
jgi:cellobiose phosphorylase